MTTEEKRRAIGEFCKQYDKCYDCPKESNDFCCCNSNLTAEPEIINAWYEHLFGKVSQDNVNHPSHYESGKFECIEVMLETQGKEAVMDFCLCNAFKYLYRHKRKNGIEDIKKAKWYIEKYIELAKEERTLTIVSVRFNENSVKNYDYEYIGKKPISVGDFVTVETEHQGTVKVEVVKVFQIAESQAEYDYKTAT